MSEKIKLRDSLSECDQNVALESMEKLLLEGVGASEIVACCNEGMSVLGDRFDAGEAFIPDLMIGGMIMKKVMDRLSPMLSGSENAPAGKTFVIGTVQYDVHDIGKDIAAMMFRSNGFNIVDLGVDVSPEKFVAAIQEHRPEFVGMSLLLTTCYKSVTATMDAIKSAGLRENVKICIGGAAASDLVAQRSGIDFYAKTAVDGVNWAKSFTNSPEA